MKTSNLFDVPKTAPSCAERIAAFKRQHKIETHRSRELTKEQEPWCACLIERARQLGYGVTSESDLFDCVAKVGRLMDEADLFVTGETEVKAIRLLCELNKIECPL